MLERRLAARVPSFGVPTSVHVANALSALTGEKQKLSYVRMDLTYLFIAFCVLVLWPLTTNSLVATSKSVEGIAARMSACQMSLTEANSALPLSKCVLVGFFLLVT